MLKLTKITSYLIITLLLLTSLSNAFGFVYCDCGSFSEIHHENHHADESHEAFGEDFSVAFDQQLEGSGDSCQDFLIQQVDGVIEKNECYKAPTENSTPADFEASSNFAIIRPHACSPFHLPPPRMAPTILAHKTVVLII